jgi:hypothetical protein
LLLGQLFVNTTTKLRAEHGNASLKSYPLLRLAHYCREPPGDALDVLEKVILLLRLGADITVVDEECNNILHCTLKASIYQEIEGKETEAKAWMRASCDCHRCNASFREPRKLLTAAIAAGADIYALNKNGDTPTMAAEQSDREAEWVEALEECGIDAEQVLLHTEEWMNVLSELDICFFHFSPEKRAKIVQEFELNLWNAENRRQESNLTFQQFCEQRDSRRKLQVECDYEVADDRYWDMVRDIREDTISTVWSEEESQRSSEMLEDTSENALPEFQPGVEVHQDPQLAGPTDTFTGDMEKDNDDGVIHVLDDLTSLVEHDYVFDVRDVHGGNRDLDIAEVYWGDDPFDLGSNYVGSPAMSFSEFMNIDAWNDGKPVMDNINR